MSARAAQPRAEVLAEVMDPCRAKGVHEHVAANEIAALRARVEVLEAVLLECADDLAERISDDYPDREAYQNQVRRYERDMRIVRFARALLEQKP